MSSVAHHQTMLSGIVNKLQGEPEFKKPILAVGTRTRVRRRTQAPVLDARPQAPVLDARPQKAAPAPVLSISTTAR